MALFFAAAYAESALPAVALGVAVRHADPRWSLSVSVMARSVVLVAIATPVRRAVR